MQPVNESDFDWAEHEGVEGRFRQKQLGAAAGSDNLGCSLYELPPDAQPWSYHYHAANEEALYILSGTGTLRLGGETYTVCGGDYVPCPADESGAHTIVNDSEETLRYLAISTMRDPDVTVHPDIGKVGVFVGAPPGSDDEREVSAFFDHDADE
ncbi:cupin domain-containing protein [Haloferax sp. MBLA0076]|uniref:Cupin domain-containing protein n=1 Tax=Haloferax litoreum TaxID=2666140 RepID=A0A6A8GG10_9EURY|nr:MULTISPECIES: cupin domain-containing protein [Haloferax]KAB1193232.1 cupin domain-containing protein [Haloferax sp. CBA1148]MRX21731.1 cupin domain-containing protein [Haloferax litoreum]